MPRRKRICLIIEALAERSGGAERVLIDLANEMAARGHEVEILSHDVKPGPPFYPLAPGVRHLNLRPHALQRSIPRRALDKARRAFHRMGAHRSPFDRLVWFSRHGGFWRRLERHLDASEPDAVVAFMPPAVIALSLAAPKKRPLKFASMHNAPEQDFENPLRWDPTSYGRRRRLELMGGIDRIGVLLPEYRMWYPPALTERVVIIPNAVRPAAPEALQEQRQPVILAVGRLAQVKRHDLLLRAFARLKDRFPDWELQIYGTGPLEAELTSLRDELGLAGRAHLMGHTKQIDEIYAKSAILAHPARYEGFPLAVTEALASGLPVVGFADCSGLNQLVQDGRNGVLVEPVEDRVVAFSRALADLMSRPALRALLGAGGVRSMVRYAPEGIYDLWEELLISGRDELGRDLERPGR
jgi:glycosyltransferase involved in cell wall biosynthesis